MSETPATTFLALGAIALVCLFGLLIAYGAVEIGTRQVEKR